jgi:hypothetical protein
MCAAGLALHPFGAWVHDGYSALVWDGYENDGAIGVAACRSVYDAVALAA